MNKDTLLFHPSVSSSVPLFDDAAHSMDFRDSIRLKSTIFQIKKDISFEICFVVIICVLLG